MKAVNEWREKENGAVEHTNEWRLENWFEKFIYILGWIWLILFCIGFIAGVLNSTGGSV